MTFEQKKTNHYVKKVNCWTFENQVKLEFTETTERIDGVPNQAPLR